MEKEKARVSYRQTVPDELLAQSLRQASSSSSVPLLCRNSCQSGFWESVGSFLVYGLLPTSAPFSNTATMGASHTLELGSSSFIFAQP